MLDVNPNDDGTCEVKPLGRTPTSHPAHRHLGGTEGDRAHLSLQGHHAQVVDKNTPEALPASLEHRRLHGTIDFGLPRPSSPEFPLP